MSANELDDAIVVYTGKGAFNFPNRSAERVEERFPGQAGVDLARRVRALETSFYEVEPRADETLIEASDRAAETFAVRHPEVGAEAVDALRWCFSFDWK